MTDDAGGTSAHERPVGRLVPERAAFEAWFSENGKWPAAVQRSGDGYMLASAQSAWTAWQAADARWQRRSKRWRSRSIPGP